MATLALTVVGTLIGGPIGGAIGGALGSVVDRSVIGGPKGRKGPRLGDLSVQTSSYGSTIPKVFGTLRVAGTVIWATGLREQKHTTRSGGGGKGGGKGGGSTTTYTYSTSFAVALSGRRILGVGRIWADGKLLRGAYGDFKSSTGYRLHLGSEDEALDPVLASAEGIATTPAYRGTAYAVFNDFQLADYGNRIPSLTFEVYADAGPVTVAAIAAEMSEGELGGVTAAAVGGYAAGGDSVRAAIETLASALSLSIADDGETLRLSDATPAPAAIGTAEIGGHAGEERAPRVKLDRRAAGTLSDEIAVSYYAPERDYQAGLQRARRGGPARRSDTIDLPAALPASQAKAIAEKRLAVAWAERATADVGLSWRRAELRPGGAVTLPGRSGSWRIAGWTLEHMIVRLKLVARNAAGAGGGAASPGRAVGDPDAVHGATALAVMDLPSIEDTPAAAPRLWIAAAGVLPGWRRATLSATLDGGTSWQTIGATALPAVIGAAATALPGGSALLIDRRAQVEIELLHQEMALAGHEDIGTSAFANAALLGEELIQFGEALQLSPTRWRIGGLLRGRRGTEAAVDGHVVGERFVLLDPATLMPFDPPAGAIGGAVTVMAEGIGDVVPAEQALTLDGHALRPPAPGQLRASAVAGGGIAISWVRRSRAGWRWLDGGDVPLAEESERYRVAIRDGSGAGRIVETATTEMIYSAAEQTADGVVGPLTIAVAQIGAGGGSLPPATITF